MYGVEGKVSSVELARSTPLSTRGSIFRNWARSSAEVHSSLHAGR